MDPLQPFGPRDSAHQAWAALLRRNALQWSPPPSEEKPSASPPSDEVQLSASAEKSRQREAARAKEAAEAREREQLKKGSRKPSFPTPTPPPQRLRSGGWILAAPADSKQSRQMEEQDLAEYSRWPDASEQAVELAVTEEPSEEFVQVFDQRRPRLLELLSRFGGGILALCIEFGVRVQSGARTGYVSSGRRVEVAPEFDDLEFLEAFARSYDEALGCGEPASRNSVAVLTHYQSWFCFHGSGSPQDFFSQAMSRFLVGDASLMPGYVEYLLRQSRAARAPES